MPKREPSGDSNAESLQQSADLETRALSRPPEKDTAWCPAEERVALSLPMGWQPKVGGTSGFPRLLLVVPKETSAPLHRFPKPRLDTKGIASRVARLGTPSMVARSLKALAGTT